MDNKQEQQKIAKAYPSIKTSQIQEKSENLFKIPIPMQYEPKLNALSSQKYSDEIIYSPQIMYQNYLQNQRIQIKKSDNQNPIIKPCQQLLKIKQPFLQKKQIQIIPQRAFTSAPFQKPSIRNFLQQFNKYIELRKQNKSQLQSELLLGNLRDEQYDKLLSQICISKEIELQKQKLVGLNICSYDDLMRISSDLAQDLCLESEQFKQMRIEYQKQEPLNQFPIFEVISKKVDNDQSSLNILVLGQTGAGKSSLINMIANACILENEDQNFRVRLIKEDINKLYSESATEKVQSYTIYGRRITQQIVLIDSPGFADTKGIQVDQRIAKDLQDLLSKQLSQLNLICLVKKESDNRLDDLTKYVLGNIFELFGKDIKKNLHLMLSYSSFINSKPKVLNVFEDKKEFNDILSEMIEPKYSQFDLGYEIIYGKSEQDRFVKNIQSFLIVKQKIESLAPQSLKLTQSVIITRLKIAEQIDVLKNQLFENLNKLTNIQRLFNSLGNNEAKTVQCTYVEQVPILDDQFVSNCLVCSETCHFPCFIKRDEQKIFCFAINRSTGKCKFCSCVWYFHRNNQYRIEIKSQSTEVVQCNFFEREQLIADYKKQVVKFYVTQQEILKLFQQINDNALLPDSFNCMKGYFQIMIETEYKSRQLGYEERINTINNLKSKYEMINSDELKQTALKQQLSPLMKLVDVSELNKLLLESDYSKLQIYSEL